MAGYARAWLGPRTWAQSPAKPIGLVAVGDSGAVLTSSNGTSWSPQTSGNSDTWLSVAYSNSLGSGSGRFCAVSFNGTVMYSDDLGVTWAYASTVPQANQWTAIAWSPALNIFAAVSQNGTNRIMTSSDGNFWSTQSNPTGGSGYQWEGLCWSPDKATFCAVAANGNSFIQTMTATSASNWALGNAITGETSNENWAAVCWSSTLGKFCAVADGVVAFSSMLSTDGVNWTPAAGGGGKAVFWSAAANLFASLGGNTIKTSAAGASWTTQTTPTGTHDYHGVLWSDRLNLFVGVGLNGGFGATPNVSSPPPATTWTPHSTGSVYTRAVAENV